MRGKNGVVLFEAGLQRNGQWFMDRGFRSEFDAVKALVRFLSLTPEQERALLNQIPLKPLTPGGWYDTASIELPGYGYAFVAREDGVNIDEGASE